MRNDIWSLFGMLAAVAAILAAAYLTTRWLGLYSARKTGFRPRAASGRMRVVAQLAVGRGEQLLPADMAEAEDSATDADDEISSGRFRTMRRRIIRHYDELLQDRDNVELRSLNEKMTIEISRQIEALLKDLSEQVEVPM